MGNWPREQLRDELLRLARKTRLGRSGKRPLAWLRTECPTLLRVAPALLLVDDTDMERESAINRVLERVVESAEIHRLQSVQSAGDLLGLSKLTDEEIEQLRQTYRRLHRNKGPQTPARYGREIRMLLAVRYSGMVIESVYNNEENWMTDLVDEFCDYLDDKDGRLTALARDLGLSSTSAEPESNEASEKADADQILPAQGVQPAVVGHNTTAITKSPPRSRQASARQPEGRESFIERAATRFALELRALKKLVARVGKRVEKYWRWIILFFVVAVSVVSLAGVLVVKTQSILPAWHEPFRTLGEIVDSDMFFWTLIAVVMYPVMTFTLELRYRIHIWISAVITCAACAMSMTIIIADAQDTNSYESAMEEVTSWQPKDFFSFDADGKCPSLPMLYVPPPGVEPTSPAIRKRLPFSLGNTSNELDEGLCSQKDGVLNLQTHYDDTNALPGDGGRSSDGSIYAHVLLRPFTGTAWTDCGIAAIPPLYSKVSTVPSFGLQFVNDEAESGYRPVVSLATGKDDEKIVKESPVIIPYNDDGDFADSPRGGWLKMAVLRKGQQYTFFVNDREVLVYDWPETWSFVHLSIQTHVREGHRPWRDFQGCQFDDFDYWTTPGR